MWRSYFTEKKWLLWSWGGVVFIILSLLAQTYIDVKINEWYKGFLRFIARRTKKRII
jgi:peptide/bleomycin uptake transporter